MSAQVTHGADTDRLRQIAEELSGSARLVLQVEHSGTSQMGTLLESWAGADTQSLAADWQAAGPQLADAAQVLSMFAKQLMEQAQQQDDGSGGGGRGGRPGPGITGPKSIDESRSRWPDLRAGLKVPNVNWPGAGALVSPVNYPFVQGVRRYYRDIYEDWQDSGLTWFEAMFVPWPMPDKFRNKYLEMADGATDWANDQYKDHVRDLPGLRQVRGGLHMVNDAVEFADIFTAPLDRALGQTAPGLAWNMVKDTVNETTEILDDPKGWWDGASGLDQAGVVVSVVPGVGLVGKGVAKGIKHGFKSVVNDSDLVRRLTDDRGSVPVDFGFGKGRPKPGDYPEWIDYSRKPSSAHPLPEDFEPGWAATTPGGERGMDYQEQVTGIERLPDGRVPEYIMRDPTNGHPVAFDGHVDASRSTPEKFSDAKDGYTSLVTDPGTPWAKGMKTTLLDEAERQTRTVPDGAVLEWQVSDPDSAAAIRDILDDEGYTNIVVEYVPKKG